LTDQPDTSSNSRYPVFSNRFSPQTIPAVNDTVKDTAKDGASDASRELDAASEKDASTKQIYDDRLWRESI
jgi:hypothetical protein